MITPQESRASQIGARRQLVRILVPLLRAISSPFYDRRYLVGRYFDASLIGWGWAVRGILMQRILGYNRHVPWPMSTASTVDDPSGLEFDPNDMQNFMHFGCYFSNVGGGRIRIGSGTVIAPNVGIVTTNHSPADPRRHESARHVTIGENCWLGMNSVILPGVTLGPNTTVGAGAIVTESFPDGHCVLIGVPARSRAAAPRSS